MSTPPPSARHTVFARGSWPEWRRIAQILRTETVGGALLVVAAVAALVIVNSPWGSSYVALREFRIGPEAFHLHLSLGTWAADGLLAIFFFLVGLELKHEFVAGDLRDPRQALVPVVAAAGGVLVPSVIYLAVNAGNPAGVRGWAIPAATDIAFALAVLAVIGSHLPGALRTFLLTLAVVDDLIAIVIIAVAYTESVAWASLGLALVPLVAFAVLTRRWRALTRYAWLRWTLLPLLGFAVWALVHESGVHATIAGVALGLAIPASTADNDHGLAHQLDHEVRPLSAAVAVPIFAFLSAGVAIDGVSGLASAFADPITQGVVAGLVLGKPVGIVAATWLVTRLTSATLHETVAWRDLVGVGLLAGIGFTVSLLIGELSFGAASVGDEHAKVGILAASALAAVFAAAVLVPRNRHYRALEAAEEADADADGVPDVYQAG